MDFGLKDKVILVTGSTKGLGKAIGEVAAQEGAIPVFTGRSEKLLEELVKEMQEKYRPEISGICIDISKKEDLKKMMETVEERYGRLDVLVNNAGIWPTAYVVEMEEEEFENTMKVNLEVPFILSKYFIQKKLAKKETGKIINIVSQAAFHGSTTGHAHYAASKSGLVGFTISLAREMASHGINVNAVAPGMVRTPMTDEALKEREDYYKSRIPIGRVAEPEEVANAVVFLASQKADYLTGITLDATGGMLMR
ncbi:MAG: SDR family oxidoreductase [Lachnospiraceae bacterium]|nr:SDR family oxidoreductase [Lachnospiraceae bacterium]